MPFPRPVLRKQTVIGSPAEPFGEPHRSEVEAKNRADRLAAAVRSASAPASRRSSFDGEDTVLGTPFDSPHLFAKDADVEGAATHGFSLPGSQAGMNSRRKSRARDAANALVRSHTRRDGSENVPRVDGLRSGTATPVAYDLEYVPPLNEVRSGILGGILRLYERGSKPSGSAENSTLSTPNRTPRPSPPPSRPGTPRVDRPRMGYGVSALTIQAPP